MTVQINRNMRKIILLAVLAISVTSCYYDNKEELYPENPNACATDSLTYDSGIKAIFSSSCAVSGCHVAGKESPTLETYAQVSANITAIERRALIEKSMPAAGPLSSCAQSQLAQWIVDGYPEK